MLSEYKAKTYKKKPEISDLCACAPYTGKGVIIDSRVWQGASMSELNTLDENNIFPSLDVADRDHVVLVDVGQLEKKDKICPYPSTYCDKWDDKHVRMPCSPQNLYPMDDGMGGKKIKDRWELIRSSLSKPITSAEDLRIAITSYNSRYANKWNFKALTAFFAQSSPAERKLILRDILPNMVQLALDLPNICTQPPPLLAQGRTRSITLSQKQMSSLLANAFFCTFPRRNTQRKQSEYSNYPDINFVHLFQSSSSRSLSRQTEKLKCIFHYFYRVTEREPSGCVTFHRRSLDAFPDWATSRRRLTKLRTSSRGTIEDDGTGMLQVDFANELIGGGVLGQGCVQEEIRFVICPELIVSRLFTEVIRDDECVVITGCERFSRYKGYADDFVWDGNFVDKTSSDRWHRRLNQLVAIDATHFKQSKEQFREKWLRRETNKAYCGFFDRSNGGGSAAAAVATGNWGCGVYRGDPHLKLLLQLMAAAECNRDVAYFTFGNSKLCREMFEMYEFLVGKGVTVGNLWNLLVLYEELVKCETTDKQLAPFLYENV
uniref:poly(ADP-ribose) glycohydrolase n=1 Tax=Strigamia maritima TaxID=126957 RepID=T1INV1_STRMM